MFFNFIFSHLFTTSAFADSPESIINTSTDIPFENGAETPQDWSPEIEEKTTSTIINGETGALEDYSMTGGMLMRGIIFGQQVDTFVCSSTLIAPDVVLLAAHCLDDTAFTFGFGEVEDKELFWTRQADLTSWDGSQQNPELPIDTIAVVDYVIHNDFSMDNFNVGIAQNEDIALLFLETPILDVEHAFLPNDNIGNQLEVGMEVDVVGWGQQIATNQFEAPPAGSYAIKQVGTSYISELGTYEFQVGKNESDVRKCHGDSGGPSFARFGGELRVIGVTSHAYDATTDCFETGGVDTRTDAYLEWIETNMVAYCDSGVRTWCDVAGIVNPSFYAEPEEEDKRLFGCSVTTQTPSTLWLCLSVGLLVFGRIRRESEE